MDNIKRIVFPATLLLIILASNTQQAFAQLDRRGGTVLEFLEAARTYAGNYYDDDNEYRWQLSIYRTLGETNNHKPPYDITCIHYDRADPGWFDGGHTFIANWDIPNLATSGMPMTFEAWQEEGCDGDCEFGTGWSCSDDVGHCGPYDFTIALYDYPPSVTNSYTEYGCWDSDDRWAVEYRFAYKIPTPRDIGVSSSNVNINGQICAAEPSLTLSANSFVNPAFLGNIRFVWQYRVNGGGWNYLNTSYGYTNNGNYTFTNLRQYPGVKDITASVSVDFMVTTYYVDSHGTSYPQSNTSEVSRTIVLNPLPPNILNVSSTPSCPNNATGTITAQLSENRSFSYVIRSGIDTNPCTGANCGGIISGSALSSPFTVPNVPSGNNTLVVYYAPSDHTNACGNYYGLTIAAEPTLQLQPSVTTQPSCHDFADGTIKLSSSGGKGTPQYTLSQGSYSETNTTGVFSGLASGYYNALVMDDCDQQSTGTVFLDEPKQIAAAVDYNSPLCNSPADGSVKVTVVQGEGLYSYTLLRNNEVYNKLENSDASTWTTSHLDDGDYVVEIIDAQRPQCEGFISSSSLIAPPPFDFSADDIVTKNVVCYGESNGSIEISDGDDSGLYRYVITDVATGLARVSTAPSFQGLIAASYSLVMRRNLQVCDEVYENPDHIVITQPEEVVITVDKKDISCFGETDGSIVATVRGSTDSDRYTWEIQTGNSWATLSNTTTSIQNLFAGVYRMRSINNAGCTAQSVDVPIIEPALLTIERVNVYDIKCLGEQGEIETIMSGGVQPYTYHYSEPHEGEFTSPSPITAFGKGVYSLRVTDVNACETSYASTMTITEPTFSLQLNYRLSKHNGYNVTCFGAADATANLTAIGGNSAGYTGYSYALDNQYQAEPIIQNIPAGPHVLSVTDGRGCVVNKSVNITEPASQLVTTVIEKENVTCYGDEDGTLSLDVSGGVAPYLYTLPGRLPQLDRTFRNLKAGSYTINIRDLNGCATSYTDEILLLTPPINVTSEVTAVSCYGGNDGAINTMVDGGAEPLAYRWDNGLGSRTNISDLKAGRYSVLITDQEGCTKRENITVPEPDSIAVNIISIPVCIGQANGELRVQASGGTSPFEYSLDGNIYQADASFTGVAAGNYILHVRDRHNCDVTTPASVIVSTFIPQPDFIVATKQNAMDTLVVKEISIPKPDSLTWTFDPAITVLNENVWEPEITVSDAGTYTISLKGYFSGCDFSKTITLNINPYDPENIGDNGIPGEVITDMTVSPNPNGGTFNVKVALNIRQHVIIKVFDIMGVVHFSENWDNTMQVEKDIDITATASTTGIYIVQVITDTDAREARIVINR